MKKQYISPSCLVTDIHVEQALLAGSTSGTIGVDEGGTQVGNELVNKKETGFGSSPWDNMGEIGNF
ncbi:MAG: hypothetical protein MR881_07685 [Bacteroidales bacterium]|nr:hypothetical protein [Bacteroidales bacterium]